MQVHIQSFTMGDITTILLTNAWMKNGGGNGKIEEQWKDAWQDVMEFNTVSVFVGTL